MIVDDTVARWTMSPNVPQELSDVRPFRPDMVWIPGGTFLMSSDRHYPEEAPVHRVHVDDFWINRHLVIRGQFRRLVAATGHITVAEVAPDPRDYPGALPDMLRAVVAAQTRSSGAPAGQWITAIAAYRKVSGMARRSNTPLADGDRIWRHSKYA